MSDINRRQFLGTAAATSVALGLGRAIAAEPSKQIVIGVMGTGGRGTGLAQTFAKLPGVTVAYTCDADENRARKAADAVGVASGGKPAQVVTDFRKILDDRDVTALVCAACNHWHAPATILACQAGKDVYVEKPCSHTPLEGEMMVQAARKHGRKVQMGNQRPSWPAVVEALELVRNGEIGRAYYAQTWYTNDRKSIGRGEAKDPPEGLNYDLWQGPSVRKPFKSNYLHYTWHWFWHWGNGELGNNGVHMIDLCRRGLGVSFPQTASSIGGRYRFEDDQETPDTNEVNYTFPGGKMITWHGLSCSQVGTGQPYDVIFHGEKGTLAIRGGGYMIFDEKGKEIKKASDTAGDTTHAANFVAAIRGEDRLHSEIEESHQSTLLCHLGNISYRTGRVLRCDPKNGHIQGDKEAMTFWTKEYEKGWEPKV